MRKFAIIFVLFVMAIGTYLNSMDTDKKTQVMIEDEVGSTMAAPAKPDIPL